MSAESKILIRLLRLAVSVMQRSGVRPSVCPVYFRSPGTHSTWLPVGSMRRGPRTFPAEYYEDEHICTM